MNYDFDEIIQRAGTGSAKYDLREKLFGDGDVIPMWVADMDFRTPDFIQRAILRRMEDPVFGYTLRGDDFFDAVSGWLSRRHGWTIQKPWLTFSPGVVTALSIAILGLTEPGDRIVIQPPVYHPFYFVINDNGRELVRNPLVLEGERYRMDLDHLRSVVDERTKMLILSNPHNPGGMAWREEELLALGEVCEEKGIILLSDEIHSDLAHEGFRHVPAASLSPAMARRTVTCMAPSKTFNTAGLAASVVIIPDGKLRAGYNRALNAVHVGFGNIFGNAAMVAAYEEGEPWLEELLAYIAGNIDFAAGFFRERIPEIRMMRPEASFLLWLDCRALGLDQKRLNAFFCEEAKLGLNDGTMFGEEGTGFMRMNIACPRSVLEAALKQLEAAVRRLPKGAAPAAEPRGK